VVDALITPVQRQAEVAIPVDHWVGSDAARDHLLEAIHHTLPGFLLVVADEHVNQQAGRRQTLILQQVNARKEPAFISEVVPRRVEAPRFELVIAHQDRRERLGGIIVDHADVDPLVQADLEPARSDLVNARFPLVAGLTEEIVIEQMQMFWIGIATPDVIDGADRARLTFLLRNDAEAAPEAATALGEPDAGGEAGKDRVVISLLLTTEAKPCLDRGVVRRVPRPTNDGIWKCRRAGIRQLCQ
jgi:hypothetical protein